MSYWICIVQDICPISVQMKVSPWQYSNILLLEWFLMMMMVIVITTTVKVRTPTTLQPMAVLHLYTICSLHCVTCLKYANSQDSCTVRESCATQLTSVMWRNNTGIHFDRAVCSLNCSLTITTYVICDHWILILFCNFSVCVYSYKQKFSNATKNDNKQNTGVSPAFLVSTESNGNHDSG